MNRSSAPTLAQGKLQGSGEFLVSLSGYSMMLFLDTWRVRCTLGLQEPRATVTTFLTCAVCVI